MDSRLAPVVAALADVGLTGAPVVYDGAAAEVLREQLLAVDGVLVWVDPVTQDGAPRTVLDAVLREVASDGVWVSAHPDVVDVMGTKEVLYGTRSLGWGSDTHLYATAEDFTERFPQRLAAGAARVLKHNRGNGGIGVWKVQLVADDVAPDAAGSRGAGPDALVRIQSAQVRDGVGIQECTLGEFLRQRAEEFIASGEGGRLVDQLFQPRVDEGMIRCYLVQDKVVGFARQWSPVAPSAGARNAPADAAGQVFSVMGLPPHKTMYDRDEPDFQELRARVEDEWVPGMKALLGLSTAALPAIWDADFLLGPMDSTGEDTYVLCEINASCVLPFPDGAPREIARTVLASLHSPEPTT
jgi:uncharacterized protein DUF6815